MPGTLAVSPVAGQNRVELHVEMSSVTDLMLIVERVKRVFDLNADPATIEAALSGDPRLRGLVQARPGLRVPGAWDGFGAGSARDPRPAGLGPRGNHPRRQARGAPGGRSSARRGV